jgi:hypothetical protein
VRYWTAGRHLLTPVRSRPSSANVVAR